MKNIFLENIYKFEEDNRKSSVFVYAENLITGEIFKYKATQCFPAASVIKIFILASLLDYSIKKDVSFNKKIYINKIDPMIKAGGSGIIKYLHNNILLTIEDLCVLMMSQSDNIATNKIVDLVGIDYINKYIKYLNLGSTKLLNKIQKGNDLFANKTSCADCVNLFKLASQNNIPLSKKFLYFTSISQTDYGISRFLPDKFKIYRKEGILDHLEDRIVVNETVLAGDLFVLSICVDGEQDKRVSMDFMSEFGALIYNYWF